MKIDKVTITGADDHTSIGEMVSLQKKYPFVEWGILFSVSKKGNPRYPSGYAEFINNGLNLSAHLCGQYSADLLERGSVNFINQLAPHFKRIQVNYNFSINNNWNIEPALKWTEGNTRSVPLIFQYNKSNEAAFFQIWRPKIPNIHVLYDASGGRGKIIDTVKTPFPVYTGYSGGISSDNVEKVIEKINAYEWPFFVWIDMESGVRTNNQLDLYKVKEVLKISSKYINR